MKNKVTLKCACGCEQSIETDDIWQDLLRPLRLGGWIKLTNIETGKRRWNCPDCYEDSRQRLKEDMEEK